VLNAKTTETVITEKFAWSEVATLVAKMMKTVMKGKSVGMGLVNVKKV
jgi:hypothetical protein